MAEITVNLTDKQVKQSAISGLEYSIASIIRQVELKFNVRITGLSMNESHCLRSVKIDWQETASGIRTQEEVQQLTAKVCEAEFERITNKLANNG